jgi:hypothetical protein
MINRVLIWVFCVLLWLGFFVPAVLHAKELEIGMPFMDARKLLIQEGWQPIKTVQLNRTGAEKHFYTLHIMEVENCAADAPYCAFRYKKGDTCLFLITDGAEINGTRDITKQTYVSSWAYTCPDEKGEDQKKQSKTKNYASMGISPFDGELPFLNVRKMLIQKGWRPISVPRKRGEEHSDLEKQLIAADIHEGENIVFDKTYPGLRPSCNFHYKKDNLCLQIMAYGKTIKDLKVFRYNLITYGECR